MLVWVVAAAHPASAAPPGVRPGGPVNSLSTPRQNTTVTSSNWAGYVATGASGTSTSASANWTEPAGRCTGRGGKYAAFWVGIDGYTSPTVEQIGTEVDCSGFYPRYYAWYEVYPAEAPCCTADGGILPLTNFGTASFASAAANGQSLATFHPTEIVMPDTSVSAISSSGGFTVSYTGFPGFPGFPWSGPGRSAAD